MKKNAQITIVGTQHSEGKPETYKLVTDGEIIEEPGRISFSYMESSLTGLEGTRTTFEVYDECTMLIREGTVSSRMMFEKGRKNYTMYETPFGGISMGVDTLNLEFRAGNGLYELFIHYTVDMDGSMISRNKFKINIREV